MVVRRMLADMLEQAMEASQQPPPGERPVPRERDRPWPPVRPGREGAPEQVLVEERVEPDRGAETPRQPRPRRTTRQVATVRPDLRSEILATLASPAGIRRSLIIHEILGPPKSLRSPDQEGGMFGR